MRPSYLNVFDGLRLTTEHFDHFQEAIHLAVRDLRSIAGLGKVYSGFAVEHSGEKSIVVHPGLAFDFQNNQVVNDDPVVVDVVFGPSQNTLYVCVQYDQVSTATVEGRATLKWDSCRIILRPGLPSPDDNQIAIARLDKRPESASSVFNIVNVLDSDSNRSENESEPRASSLEPTVSETPGPTVDLTSTPSFPTNSSPAIGTVKLAGELDTTALLVNVQEILAQLPGDPTVSPMERTLLILADPVLAVPFPRASISLELFVTAKFVLPRVASEEPNSPEPDGPSATERLSVNISAHTEATRTDAVQQRSISSTQISSPMLIGQESDISADVDDAGILKFRCGQLRRVRESTISDILEHLVIRIALEAGDDSSLRLTCVLVWDQNPSSNGLAVSEMRNFALSWSIQTLWRATKL